MTNDLQTGPPRGAPVPAPPTLERALRRAFNDVSGGFAVSLAPETRERLRSRGVALAAALTPGTERAILDVLIGLSTMPSQISEVENTEAALRIAVLDLSDVPLFSLQAAAAAFRQGRAGDGRFRPSTAELAQLARRNAQPLAEEAHRIRRVLEAPAAPAAAGARDRVRALHEELMRELHLDDCDQTAIARFPSGRHWFRNVPFSDPKVERPADDSENHSFP